MNALLRTACGCERVVDVEWGQREVRVDFSTPAAAMSEPFPPEATLTIQERRFQYSGTRVEHADFSEQLPLFNEVIGGRW